MTDHTTGPADEAAVPDWLVPLVDAARSASPEELAMFLPPDDGGRQSAVLIAFAQAESGPGVLLLQRAAGLRRHPGQVAFPGGQLDPGDAGPVAAALREAREEVGLDPASVQPLVQLPAIFIPPSGFVVTPVLAWWQHPHPVGVVDTVEVARVAVLPVAELCDPVNRFGVTHPSGWVGPGFEVDGFFVWGFTAVLLDRLLAMAGWTRPWDETRRRAIP